MTRVETRVRIERSIGEVFAYVAEPRNFPTWNSAVSAVQMTSAESVGGAGSTYLMERRLPIGRVENELVVVIREWPARFAIKTTSGPTPFLYEFRFTADGGTTLIELEAEAELRGVAELLGPLARLSLQRGVNDNLAALKAILDEPHAVSV